MTRTTKGILLRFCDFGFIVVANLLALSLSLSIWWGRHRRTAMDGLSTVSLSGILMKRMIHDCYSSLMI